MRKLFILVPFLILGAIESYAQIFWTENFESGSSFGFLADAYISTNGAWTTTSTGTNDTYNNVWYVSCAENGHTAGECQSNCLPVTSTATLSTLHIGTRSIFGGDNGAYYNAGTGTCPTLCVTTNLRAKSPTINCSARTGISVHFYYIEGGDGTTDDATVWYYDGASWSLLLNTPKTPTTCSGGLGVWNYQTITLPVSADHNPNVKIGFNWTNNTDGAGTEPSFAVDSVYLTGASSGGIPVVASFTSVPASATICQDSCITFTSTSTGDMDSIRWVGVISGFPVLLGNTNPFSFCATAPFNLPGTYTMRLRVYGSGNVDSASAVVTVDPTPHPVISRAGHALSVSGAYTSYQWSDAGGPIAGATNATYTYSVSGTYKIAVDSGRCIGSATMAIATLAASTINDLKNEYWLSRSGNDGITLHASTPLQEPLTLTVRDAAGRQVLTENWSIGTGTKQLDIASQPPGLYIIKLSGNTTSAVLKWVQ